MICNGGTHAGLWAVGFGEAREQDRMVGKGIRVQGQGSKGSLMVRGGQDGYGMDMRWEMPQILDSSFQNVSYLM